MVMSASALRVSDTRDDRSRTMTYGIGGIRARGQKGGGRSCFGASDVALIQQQGRARKDSAGHERKGRAQHRANDIRMRSAVCRYARH